MSRPGAVNHARAALQAARVACASVLISCFLWTAHFVLYAPWPVARYVIAFPEWVLSLAAADPRLDAFRVLDYVCLGLLGAMVLATFALGRRKGNGFAALKALQVGSLMMMLLGLIVVGIDRSDLWLYVTLTQHETRFAPWFSNGADLISSCLAFAATTGVLLRRFR